MIVSSPSVAAATGTVPAKAEYVLGTRVDATSYEHASASIRCWAQSAISKYVCVATVNNIMESYDSADFQGIMNDAALVTPDGMPLVWGLRLLGHKDASRVYGPDLMPCLLNMAALHQIPVGFYGSTPETLEKLRRYAQERFARLDLAYVYSPPFRPLTEEEDQSIVNAINSAGVRILFIGLNTPKQEYWMAAHRGSVQSVMIGVGAAFDFLSGSKVQAPRWMMPIGMEWFFRLVTEPRRLWKRYLKHNPRFVVLFAMQVLGFRKFKTRLDGTR